MNTLIVRDDFSSTPGSRFIVEGEYSGELFRTDYLLPIMRESIANGIKLKVVLDGTAGFGTSFLEESFGGLIRIDNIEYDSIKGCLELVSVEEPYLKDDIHQYLLEAASVKSAA